MIIEIFTLNIIKETIDDTPNANMWPKWNNPSKSNPNNKQNGIIKKSLSLNDMNLVFIFSFI